MNTEQQPSGRTLALFDFDGTLTRGDTLLRFLIFAVPPFKLISGVVPLMLSFLLLILQGKWSAGKAKEMLFRLYFKNTAEEKMVSLGISYFQQLIPLMLNPEMLETMRSYKKSGATVAIVSASIDVWLMPFCNFEQVDCICTQLKFEGGVFSGYFQGKNCKGAEKVLRITAQYDVASFHKIIAYGNSSGDRDMLAMADEPHWV